MAITGDPDGGPVKVGVAVSDLFAGCTAPVSFPPALDADGEKLRREFGLPAQRKA